jgi:hypothetical protein
MQETVYKPAKYSYGIGLAVATCLLLRLFINSETEKHLFARVIVAPVILYCCTASLKRMYITNEELVVEHSVFSFITWRFKIEDIDQVIIKKTKQSYYGHRSIIIQRKTSDQERFFIPTPWNDDVYFGIEEKLKKHGIKTISQ